MDVTIESLPPTLSAEIVDALAKLFSGSYHEVLNAMENLPCMLHVGGWRKEALSMHLGGQALLLIHDMGGRLKFEETTAIYFGKRVSDITNKTVRIIGENDKSYAVTMDLGRNRLDVYLVHGRVVYASNS